MITVIEETINVFSSDNYKWIAVVRNDKAILLYSMATETKHEIVEEDTKEELLATLASRGIQIVESLGR